MGRFFLVGRSCSVPDFTGFPRVFQCAGQAFYVEMLASQKRTLRGCVWMLSSFLLAGAVFVGGVVAFCCCGLRVWWVCRCERSGGFVVAWGLRREYFESYESVCVGGYGSRSEK